MSFSRSRPARLDRTSRAPPKLTWSCFLTKPMTSPPAPHPKQWKSPRLGVMVKDGVLSSWNGHRPTSTRPFFLSSIPRSATTECSSFADLIRSIPSLLTCISPLLFSEGRKGPVFQSPNLELEEREIDTRPSPVVVALGVLHLGARDLEDRHPPPVR